MYIPEVKALKLKKWLSYERRLPGTNMKHYSFNNCSTGMAINTTEGVISFCSRYKANAERILKKQCASSEEA